MRTMRAVATLAVFASFAGVLQLRAEFADAELVSFVEKRVQAWQPTSEERRFDEIGWVTNIREAERIAARHKRAIFYFTHDGRMAIGRC